jgi:hypothetical protein
MPSDPLQNLVSAKQLKAPPDRKEFEKLVQSGRARLADARRPENRYLVFQCLVHTAGLAAGDWRVLALAHERRNEAEYSGEYSIDERLLAEVIRAVELVLGETGGSRAAEIITTLAPNWVVIA